MGPISVAVVPDQARNSLLASKSFVYKLEWYFILPSCLSGLSFSGQDWRFSSTSQMKSITVSDIHHCYKSNIHHRNEQKNNYRYTHTISSQFLDWKAKRSRFGNALGWEISKCRSMLVPTIYNQYIHGSYLEDKISGLDITWTSAKGQRSGGCLGV